MKMDKMASNHQDVEVFDNWEDMDNSEILEERMKDILSPHKNKSESKSSNKAPVNVILVGEDALRSQYVAPKPTVKILKRPSNDAQLLNGDCKPRQQFKTLKQREQEYAEARLRILGEAHSSEKEEKICGIQSKLNQPTAQQSENIIRLPHGPDGSKGFTVRR